MSEQKKASFSLVPWKQLLPIVMRYKWSIVVIIVTNVLLAIIDLLYPLLQSRAVDRFIVAGTLEGFGGSLGQYVALMAVEIVLLVAYFRSCMKVEMCAGRDLKEACFVNLQ